MRPVEKPNVGQSVIVDANPHRIHSTYRPYGDAKPVLEAALGYYCSYCETFSTDLEVEHIVPKTEDPGLENNWDNFLLACGRCNGKDNKGNQLVQATLTAGQIYLPHVNNTFMIFEYLQDGVIRIQPTLSPAQTTKAQNLLNLVKIDKYPGNPRYPTFPRGDNRWRLRREEWVTAELKLEDYRAGTIHAPDLADYAKQRGFFSIWFTVFAAHTDVKLALIRAFAGTASTCFDPHTGASLPRNPGNTTDPI